MMETIEIKQEPGVSDGPENNIYIYEEYQIKLESNTGIADELKPNSFSEDTFSSISDSISIKDEYIDEKSVTSHFIYGFGINQNISNTFNNNRITEERIINENITFSFVNQNNFIDDKSILKPITTIIESEKQPQPCDDINSIKIIGDSNQLDKTSNTNKRKLTETSPNESYLQGVSPKRRKTNESKKYSFNNNGESKTPTKQTNLLNYITKFHDSSNLTKRKTNLSDHVKTTVNLKKLYNVKVILERFDVEDYLSNQKTGIIKNIEDPKNIKNTKSDLKNIPKLSVIKRKSNNNLKFGNKEEKASMSKLYKNIDLSSIIIKYEKCNEICKSTDRTINPCQKCKTKLTYMCQTCKVRCTTYNGIIRHVKNICKRTDSYYYYCDDCTFKSQRKTFVKYHILDEHLGQTVPRYKCSKCSRSYKHKRHLTLHQRTCGLSPHLFCTFCSLKSKRKHDLMRHVKRFHTDKFKSDEELNNIMKKIVEKGKAIIADSNEAIKSGKLVASYTGSTKTLYVVNFVNRYCSKCNKTYYPKGFNKTRRCPECETPFLFKCKKCKKTCKHYRNIFDHVRFRCYSRNIFKCDHCSFKTTEKQTLTDHMQNKHLTIDPDD